jgi:RNA polymerase sigma-70 factor (ECF subfamily)
MKQADGSQTSVTLLERVRDWGDHPAWAEFYRRYDPLLREWSRRSGLDEHTARELCQRVWVELADRMPVFRYDPGRRFRGWLRNLWRFRVLDLIDERRREDAVIQFIDEWDEEDEAGRRIGRAADRQSEEDAEPEAGHRRSLLFREAERAQAAVRARVDSRTWEVYWRIAVDGWSVRETSSAMGMSYAAAFAAQQRVDRRLREEGERLLAALANTDR